MCGIVGVIGARDAAPLLLDALRRLEYRGYDSAGIALVKQSVASQNSTLSGTVTNGDNHVGAHLCSFHVSKAGNSYDVDFYASGLPAGVTASDFCSTAVENAFLDGLPSS